MLWQFSICIFSWSCLLSSCMPVDSNEFEQQFKTIANQRIEFRRSLKALGDSSYAHRDLARKVLASCLDDTVIYKFLAPNYLAYNDSLMAKMSNDLAFFEAQFVKEKPLINGWERLDMEFDGLVEKMKAGDLSEKEGLDSLLVMDKQLKEVIDRCDSDEAAGTKRYWAFRQTWEEYQRNMQNLKALYSNQIYRQ